MTTEAKDWLVIYFVDGDRHIAEYASSDEALADIRRLVEGGNREATVYRRVPFTIHVDIEIDGERPKRRRNSSPGPASGADAHAAPVDAPEPGDSKGAASQHAAERVECRQEARNRGAPLAPATADPAHTAGTDPASPPSCGGKLCAVADGKVVHRLDPSCSKFSGTKRARA